MHARYRISSSNLCPRARPTSDPNKKVRTAWLKRSAGYALRLKSVANLAIFESMKRAPATVAGSGSAPAGVADAEPMGATLPGRERVLTIERRRHTQCLAYSLEQHPHRS